MRTTKDVAGEAIAGQRSPGHPPSEQGVTKTILFIDVVASTDFARTHGDERWRTVVYRHERAVEAVARRYGGTVASFLGDGFLLLFDDACDGVMCAIRLQLANDVQGAFEVRMGLDVGEVLPFGDGRYVGYAIHVASRITDLSDAGEITMSDECRRQAVATIAVPPAVERVVALRGCDGPTTVHTLTSVTGDHYA